MSYCWQRWFVYCSAANQVRSPGINNNCRSDYIGGEVTEWCSALNIRFWLSFVASGIQSFKYRPPGWALQHGASVTLGDSGEVSSFSALDSLISFSVCFLTRHKRTVLWGCLLLSWDFSQEIAKLILEAKTVERGSLQMQPEYLLSNQLWNLIDAKAFSEQNVY